MRTHLSVSWRKLSVSLLSAMALQAPLFAESGKAPAPARVRSDDLGGVERWLAHVSTDKPIYRTGEKVYVRSVVLDAASHKPGAAPGQAFFQITGPKGDTVASGYAGTEDSVSGFAWDVPAEIAGGEYAVTVSYPQLGIVPGKRKFDVRAFRPPRLKSQIVFFRDGYGPGDTVSATLDTKRAEGGVPENAKVTITARVDGEEVHASASRVNAQGLCAARFRLPANIERGEGTLAFTIEDGGVVETATKTIPILLQTIDLQMHPEGGELVAGFPNRVYLQARTPAQKPADLAGVILNGKGKQVATLRTEHEGRGRFTFTPEQGEAYVLKITEPAGIRTNFPLSAVRDTGATIQALREVYERNGPVKLKVVSTAGKNIVVTIAKRETELASVAYPAPRRKGATLEEEVSFTLPSTADGVLLATVWDEDGQPLAERLIHREPAKALRVDVKADKSKYVPGAPAKLTVSTRDDRGKPVSAVVGLTVTDDSVLELIEKREQPPRLPVMVLLEADVKDLADAHVYLDPANPKAELAVDLLLGTQGWRRFALVKTSEFLGQYGDDARRVLALRTVTRHEVDELSLATRRRGGVIMHELRAAGAMDGKAAEAVEKGALSGMVRPQEVPPPAPPKPVARPASAAEPPPSIVAAAQPREELVAKLEVAQKEARRKSLVARDAERELREDRAFQYVAVRVYAHQARPGRQPGDRLDFTETIYWHAGVKTDASGEASVAFAMSDAVTSFRVFADAFDRDGALGECSATVASVEPFYVEPKLPLEVTAGDRIVLPVSLVNATDARLDNVTLKITTPKGIEVQEPKIAALGGDARMRQTVPLAVNAIVSNAEVVIAASAGAYNDRVTRALRTVPRGFPVEVARGGMLQPNAELSLKLNIPPSRVAGSVSSRIVVYPTPLANLTEALARLLREPNGCFEQTSSTTYPLVMAQSYFVSHAGVDPKLIERGKELLEKGYKRLTGFECKERGYEWFGQSPGHEALTAYGLLEFTDMAGVHSVDQDMLQRTRQWLLAVRDGKGGFKRERRALHTWIADPDCSNGYIVWALLACGESADSLKAEIAEVKRAAAESKNSYAVALGANVAALGGDAAAAKKLMDRLATAQGKDGCVQGATTSIVGSGGEALQIETTALAVLAWLRDSAYAGNVEAAIRWLAESCKAGRFGSTQSTVLALRAILEYDKARSKPKAPGELQLTIDGRVAGSAVRFDKDAQDAIALTDISEMLEPGEHTLTIKMTGGSEMPFALAVRYSAEQPDTSAECKVGLEVALSDRALPEGAVTEANVTVVNRSDTTIPMPVAIIGIPGGLEVRHDQLKELVKAEKIAAYEVLGRDVVLYWRALSGGQKVRVPISLVAAIPGDYTGPASRAYQYYTDEHRLWVAPLQVAIAAK